MPVSMKERFPSLSREMAGAFICTACCDIRKKAGATPLMNRTADAPGRRKGKNFEWHALSMPLQMKLGLDGVAEEW